MAGNSCLSSTESSRPEQRLFFRRRAASKLLAELERVPPQDTASWVVPAAFGWTVSR